MIKAIATYLYWNYRMGVERARNVWLRLQIRFWKWRIDRLK
jgi:hypothetical protein